MTETDWTEIIGYLFGAFCLGYVFGLMQRTYREFWQKIT